VKGGILNPDNGFEAAVKNFLKDVMEKADIDALLLPFKNAVGDSFEWRLVTADKLAEASVVPPVIAVNGARALSSITRSGKSAMKIAALMRPCEARAAIELSKLNQCDLEPVVLISMDCPGAMPLQDYIADPEKVEKEFEHAAREWNNELIRPICRMCDIFTCTESTWCDADIHVALPETENNAVAFISNTDKGREVLEKVGIGREEELGDWQKKMNARIEERKAARKKAREELKQHVTGLNSLSDTFGSCINCQVCRSVCPVCYCRQCLFNSVKVHYAPDDYLLQAESKGTMKFTPDTLLFQTGRMTHMSVSCVGCGACEDCCPMDIKVAQIFSIAADETQKLFDYIPGKRDAPPPLRVYNEQELKEYET